MIKAIIFDYFDVLASADGQQHRPNEPLLAFITTQLKPRYKIGILSNAGLNWPEQTFDKKQLVLFDATAMSYETGHTKPAPDAYHVICQRLGVKPSEAVFIDDQEGHCAGARAAGLQALLYRDFDTFATEIRPLLS